MKHGWILVIKGMLRGKRFATFDFSSDTASIKQAWVYNSRIDARAAKFNSETIRKVSLNKKGKAVKIIGRG